MILALNEQQLNDMPDLRSSYFEARTRVFHKEMGWEIPLDENGWDRDQFDSNSTVYFLALEHGEIKAFWRVMPTTGPYMIGSVFQDLYPGTPPVSPYIWESSRYVILEKHPLKRQLLGAQMFCAFAELAITHGIEEVVMAQHPSITEKAHALFGIPKIMTPPRPYGVCDAHVVSYRPEWSSTLTKLRHLFEIPAPIIDAFGIVSNRPTLSMAAE